MSKISRRDFLKATTATIAGAAVLGLTGCTTEEKAPAELKVRAAFFSATEGVKNAANLLAHKFSSNVELIDQTTISARTEEVSFAQDELAIIAAPSYGGQIPMLDGIFANLKGSQTPCVLVCGYGNRHYENAFAQMNKIVSENGFVVVGAIALITPHVFSEKAGHSRPSVDDQIVMEEFAAKVKEKLNGEITALAIEGDSEIVAKELKVAEKKFNAENCVKCGACVTNCPAGAIDASTLDIDPAKCIHCQRCTFVCNFNARTFDNSPVRDFLDSKLFAPRDVEYFI